MEDFTNRNFFCQLLKSFQEFLWFANLPENASSLTEEFWREWPAFTNHSSTETLADSKVTVNMGNIRHKLFWFKLEEFSIFHFVLFLFRASLLKSTEKLSVMH